MKSHYRRGAGMPSSSKDSRKIAEERRDMYNQIISPGKVILSPENAAEKLKAALRAQGRLKE
jgi:hypothetical protein